MQGGIVDAKCVFREELFPKLGLFRRKAKIVGISLMPWIHTLLKNTVDYIKSIDPGIKNNRRRTACCVGMGNKPVYIKILILSFTEKVNARFPL